MRRPSGPSPSFRIDGSTLRVFQGGCWLYILDFARVTFHGNFAPGLCDSVLGFRLVRRLSALELIMEDS